ncbi:ABC transporter permease [Sporolactobacillus shoreae]|uniref:Transport permease protein n=1 Tax=Sporolactobacillus shoreae TaxID=1465501 RepID=A0A4Z0GPC3_9BACL|nr:ABC transporter permease [Sporolactobacillus shoreae]TGA98173.1 ABC transporter permease [Sporolactobacillus shoreae]
MNLLSIIWAEVRKSHRHNFNNHLVYFSLFVWPAILFINAYYAFKPFNLQAGSPLARFVPFDKLGLFLITGYLAYIFFWSLVQSAWQMAYERQQGTLELLLLTPVPRIWLMFGRAAANLIEAVWLFSAFSLLIILFMGGVHVAEWWLVPVAIVLLVLSAVIWGGFLNIIFLFSRDAGVLYTLFEAPMEFFSGVRMPVLAFPIWAKSIAFLFPLTYVLTILRGVVMEGKTFRDLSGSLILLLGVLTVLVIASLFLVRVAERHAKETGNLTLF